MTEKKTASPKVLVLATSRNTRGGITSVVNAHTHCDFWTEYQVKWIETHLDKGFLYKLGYAIKSMFQFLSSLPHYDLIHMHISEAPSLIRKIPFFLLGKLFKKKIVVHFHSFSPETTIQGKFGKLYQYIFKHADKVIVLSGLWKKWIHECFDLEKNVEIVYNPCMPVSEAMRSHARKPEILYAGAVCQRKGYEDLIKGFARIAAKYPEWKLIIAGNGEIRKGEALAESLHIATQVEFAGWVSGKEKENLFSSASLFCLPSYAEGFPVAILDACSYDLPFITTPVGGIPDIITDGENGLLFSPGDIETLAVQLDKLISDTTLRSKLSHESHLLATHTFHLATIDKKIKNIYESLLQDRK